ncbi:MAG: hypothetical protein JOZ38_06400 [Candidatus Eremiobacteraeota bacterium]|nr:hypothetical protein [Candidatus Eremiobacteraeota bacterium]
MSEEHPEAAESRAFVVGGNTNTLAFVNSFRGENGRIAAHVVPLAWTPLGVVSGDLWQRVEIPAQDLAAWIDQTFPPDDERAFLAPMRDIELLARTQWEALVPSRLDERTVINLEDLPDEIAEALAHPPAPIVQCAACRRLCVRDDFKWGERQLCAWDYHATVFGKRGPWRNGAYEERFFETLPRPAYVAPPLLEELHVEVILATNAIDDALARSIVNQVLDRDEQRAHLAVRLIDGGYTLLRERST